MTIGTSVDGENVCDVVHPRSAEHSRPSSRPRALPRAWGPRPRKPTGSGNLPGGGMTTHRESPGFSLGVDVNVCEPSAAAAELPVGGEVSDHLWQHVAEGQPMLLVREGRPAADLWRE